MQQGYTGPEVCKITGISYRQLDHWTSTGLINASIRNIKGSGFHRLYSFNDIVLVKLVNKLRDACLLYTSPSPRDTMSSRMPSSA